MLLHDFFDIKKPKVKEDSWHGGGNEPKDAWHSEAGVVEGRVASPVSRAITHRILDQRQDLLKFGPQAVMDAVEQVAEWVGEVEEIGNSDISAWVAQVARHLQTQDEQGVAETNVSKYADLGATNDTTHFIKNITTGKIVSPHRGRQDAEDALVANMRDSDDEFKIVRARKKQGVAESAGGPSWPEVISALTQGYPDIDPTDALKPLMQKYRVSYDYFDKLAQQQGYKDLFDAYAEFEELPTTGPTMSKGVAEDTDPLLHIKKLSGL